MHSAEKTKAKFDIPISPLIQTNIGLHNIKITNVF